MAPLKRKSSVNESSNSKKPKGSNTPASSQHHASSAFEPNTAGARAQGFSSLVTSGPSETAFPRGGGTKLSAAEVKAAQREGKREADAAVDHSGSPASGAPKAKKPRRDQKPNKKSLPPGGQVSKGSQQQEDTLRVEHLNYKRLAPGHRVLGTVVQVRPLELILSLPNQLLGHVPITAISSYFTKQLAEEANKSDSDSDQEEEGSSEDEEKDSELPELSDWFQPGQLVTAAVTDVKPVDVNKKSIMGTRKDRIDEEFRFSRRLELSLDPAKINQGIKKEDLVSTLVLPAAVKSVEDKGYVLDLGIPDMSAFLTFDQVKKSAKVQQTLSVGQLVSIKVDQVSANGRTVSLSMAADNDALMNPPSVAAILPGTLVQATISAVLPYGLNFKFLGFFDGTADLYHIPLTQIHTASSGVGADLSKSFKPGKKVKARVLWNAPSMQSGGQVFALSLLPHVVSPTHPSTLSPEIIRQAFPPGRVLDAVSVLRVEPDFGLACSIAGPTPEDPPIPAFVHLSRISDEHMQSIPPASKWKAGTVHRARVVGFSAFDSVLQLSLQPSVVDASFFNVSDLQVGAEVKGTVKSLTDQALFVSLEGSVDAVVWSHHISDIKLKHAERKFKPGVVVKGRIFAVDTERARVSMTLKKSLLSSKLPVISAIEEAKVGQDVDAVISRVRENGAIVELFGGLKAFVPIGEVSNEYTKSLDGVLTAGQPVKIRILKVDVPAIQMVASMRHALEPPRKASKSEKKKEAKRQSEKERQEALDAQPFREVTDLQPFLDSQEPVKGLVKNIASSGLFVALSTEVTARVLIKEMFDEYVKDWKAKFEVGQEVEGRITSIDVVKGQVEMSLRRNASAAKEGAPSGNLAMEDFKAGQLVKAFVKSVQAFGVFLRIDNSRVSGLCHRTEVSDDEDDDWATKFHQGDDIRALIIEVDLEKQRISFSLKESRITEAAQGSRIAQEVSASDDDGDDLDIILQQEQESQGQSSASDSSEEEDGLPSDDNEDVEMAGEAANAPKPTHKPLEVKSAFNWQGLAPGGESDGSDSDDEPDAPAPVPSTSKMPLRLADDRTADLDSQAPTTASDFERLLLGSPNSSLLWIQYMSFFAQASDLPKAREIAKRALRTINYREQDEKQNVWTAFLNLENIAGTDESLEEAFKEAASTNDPKAMYQHMLQILEKGKKTEKAEELWQNTVKKFSQDPSIWQRFAQFYFRIGQLEDARSVLPRSLKSLPKNTHTDHIAKFAQMEFKQGDPERGRTVFEGVLESHPKRLDLLNVYIDMESKASNYQAARNLFKRALDNQKLSSKKAKFLLKKYLTFEKAHGDSASVEQVKKRAAQWVAEHSQQQQANGDSDQSE